MDPAKACDTCAFGTSGGAADEVSNRLKGKLAAFSGVPFFCHHARSGEEYDWREGKLGPLALPPSQRRICAGWKRAVKHINSADGIQGWIREEAPEDAAVLRRYQRGLGNSAMNALDRFLNEKDPSLKELEKAKLTDLAQAILGAK